MGVTQAAGLSLRWFRDTFGAGVDDGRDPYERLIARGGLRSGRFGRAVLGTLPHGRAHAAPRSQWRVAPSIGLSGRARARARRSAPCLEGVAYSLKDTFTIFEEMGVPVDEDPAGRRRGRSPLWRQIQADVYGREVEIVEAEEGAAYGAAILAGVGAGVWTSVDEACEAVVRVAGVTPPKAGRDRSDERTLPRLSAHLPCAAGNS